MKLKDVQVGNEPLVLATAGDVDALESRLWITFPHGYREFVTRLGEGVLSDLVRIYPPWRVEKELEEWRRRISKYWLWDQGRERLPKERAVECVVIGDTMNGDELVFHPTRPNRLFVLPHESETIVEAGRDVPSAVEWMCGSGELAEPIEELRFEPFDSRTDGSTETDGETRVADPQGESLDEITSLAQQWSERHRARKQAEAKFKPFRTKGRKAELLYESITFAGQYPHHTGYEIAWRLSDKGSGLELAVFRWHMDGDGSYGSSYSPNNDNLDKLGLPRD